MKYEYMVITVDGGIDTTREMAVKQLNELGAQGWELCAVQQTTLFLKRQLP